MTNAIAVLLRAYKLLLSPHLPGACGFEPSCSEYAAEALARHGMIRGSALAARRLLRCHPFSAGGFDPVPIVRLQGETPRRADGIPPATPAHRFYSSPEGKTN